MQPHLLQALVLPLELFKQGLLLNNDILFCFLFHFKSIEFYSISDFKKFITFKKYQGVTNLLGKQFELQMVPTFKERVQTQK